MEITRRLEWFADAEGLAEQYPPVPASKAIPKWFQDMPTTHGPETERTRQNLTLKGCPGVIDYMMAGFILPLWADYEITVHKDGVVEGHSSDPLAKFMTMHPGATQGYPFEAGVPRMALKFDSPWRLRTPPGTSVQIQPVTYNVPGRVDILPGIVHTDFYHQINSICWWTGGPGTKLFKAGTPWLHILPFVRDKWTTHAEYNPEEVAKTAAALGGIGKGGRLMVNAYREQRKKQRRYL